MVRRRHYLNIRAKSLPERRERGDFGRVSTIGRGDNAPAVLEQAGKARIRPRVFGSGNRVSGDNRGAGERRGQRFEHRFLGRADIADHGPGGQGRGDFSRRIGHGANGDAQDYKIRRAHGPGRTIADGASKPARGGAGAGGGVSVISGGGRVRQVFAHREADRPAEQAEADDGDVAECHRAPSAISRKPSAMSSICSAVPIVIRSPCGRP